MPPRKYVSGWEKLKKKQKIEKFMQSQTGALDKFIFKLNETGNERENENEEALIEDENLVHQDDINENDNEEGLNKEHENLVNEESSNEYGPLNIYDPGNWDKIGRNHRELLVERGPIRVVVDFPKDNDGRHFSRVHYTRQWLNGEKRDRKWLVYSLFLNSVFCFCCKLFRSDENKNQLATNGFNNWKNISQRLLSHEGGNEHISCMKSWLDLEMRLKKNETIDSEVQQLINKEREHWK